MQMRQTFLRYVLLVSAIAACGSRVFATEVTPERLANPEPGNWLTNHRTYDSQRYSPLDQINKGSSRKKVGERRGNMSK
jgi:alcohol dehydrogenase (cytochrome c)